MSRMTQQAKATLSCVNPVSWLFSGHGSCNLAFTYEPRNVIVIIPSSYEIREASNPLTSSVPSLCRYNEERPPSDEDDADSGSESDSGGSSKAENIYEEIADGVRSRIGSGEGGGGGGRGGTSGGGGGSGTSLNSDSGVGNGSNNGSGGSGSGGGADRVNRRKFSSETLDFGPKSTHGRKISR